MDESVYLNGMRRRRRSCQGVPGKMTDGKRSRRAARVGLAKPVSVLLLTSAFAIIYIYIIQLLH